MPGGNPLPTTKSERGRIAISLIVTRPSIPVPAKLPQNRHTGRSGEIKMRFACVAVAVTARGISCACADDSANHPLQGKTLKKAVSAKTVHLATPLSVAASAVLSSTRLFGGGHRHDQSRHRLCSCHRLGRRFSRSSATDAGAVDGRVRTGCADNYLAYCSQHDPDGPGTRRCMRANGPKLSQSCIDALVAAGEVSKREVSRRAASK